MSNVLIVVDVQWDFVEGGSLAVEGGLQVARNIERYIGSLPPGAFDRIVATGDWHHAHSDNGGHFADEPDFVDTWPRHCVAGTHGADYAWNADIMATEHVRKGWGEPAYSAFEGHNPDTLKPFTVDADDYVEVCGLAADYCVLQTVIDARRITPRVVVVPERTAAVGDTDEALRKLREAGALLLG